MAIDSSPARHTVLVVDDDPLMAHLASEILKLAGYSTLEAVSPEQALEVFEHNRERVDLLLSDVTMPGMNGRELGSRLCEGSATSLWSS